MTKTRTASQQRRRTVSERPETLVSLLRERARTDPDAAVYEFIEGDGQKRTLLTAGELDRRARDLGARLQAQGAQGSRAVLLLPPGPDFVSAYFGCLYAGAVAVPLVPPEDSASSARLRAIVRDAGAAFAFAWPAGAEALQNGIGSGDLSVLSPHASGHDCAEDWVPPLLEATSLAHLQYTSGPAGSPRGVMLSHRNLLHNAAVMARALDVSLADRVMSWVPPHHEMGLMLGLLLPLQARCTGVLMDPAEFLKDPLRWLQVISDHEVTVTGAPNFAYDLCVRHTSESERTGLRLGHWRVAMNGCEPVQARTLKEFSSAFAPCGFDAVAFYPFYGAAEATLLVTGGGRPTAPVIGAFDAAELDLGRARLVAARTGRLIPSCGQPRPGQAVRIVDPASGQLRPAGEVGEIWVGGPSVSAGYWRRRAESADAFGAFVRDTGEGPFTRTGDSGFLLGGELFVSGRLHIHLEIDGQRILPEVVEEIAGSHGGLRPGGGAAFTVSTQGGKSLVIVQEIDEGTDPEAAEVLEQSVRAGIADRLGVPVHDLILLPAGALPKSAVGKVRREECRQRYLEGTLASVIPSPPAFR